MPAAALTVTIKARLAGPLVRYDREQRQGFDGKKVCAGICERRILRAISWINGLQCVLPLFVLSVPTHGHRRRRVAPARKQRAAEVFCGASGAEFGQHFNKRLLARSEVEAGSAGKFSALLARGHSFTSPCGGELDQG